MPATASAIERRRLLAYAGAVGAAAVVVGAADSLRPRSARAALLLAEAEAGVDTIQEAQAVAAESAWGGQSNGRIAALTLTVVPANVAGSGLLRDDAARQYFGLSLAFQSALNRALVITEAYRSYERQVDYWNRYQAGTGNLAAYPGTSNHGWGISCDFGSGVDVAGSAAKRWMDANAPRFGWSPTGNTFSRPEPWHFDFEGAYTGPASSAANEGGLVALRVPENMPGVGTSYTCVVGLRFLRHFTTIEKVNAFRAIGVPYFDNVSRSHFELLVDALSIPRSAVTTNADYWRA
ncbi:D-alanyl-D-alanine carboxypeptidase family protein [Frigoribacterium sp. CFBP 8751]|uniref:D-alanyl-D-alanine carboxypeptidase family protein n=1 Tax=Frigoribacterium sp. CFBP 8751 TaxID=2775277 RepID=UPI001785ECE9|nr:D-alanyl-D-alanine carboxypeptidase family protein [Frigoribacterium sp. CFBP 8751]